MQALNIFLDLNGFKQARCKPGFELEFFFFRVTFLLGENKVTTLENIDTKLSKSLFSE